MESRLARLLQPTLSFFFVVLQTMFRGLVAAVLSFIFSFPLVSAFTYSFGTPSECDNFPLTWTGESFVPNFDLQFSCRLPGGTPPFQLSIIPVRIM
jgi:hypothetical protein